MAKRYFKIHPKMKNEWLNLSRNQIVMMLIFFYHDSQYVEYFKKLYYGRSNKRFIDDKKVIAKYSALINEMVEYDDIQKNSYLNMKISTLKILVDNKLKKPELLIIMYLMDKYRVNYYREYEFETKVVLKEIFNYERHNITTYKKVWEVTLQKLKNWEYEDHSVFIKEFRIIGNKTIIFLDESKRKKKKKDE